MPRLYLRDGELFGSTWSDLVDLIETKTSYGVDLEYRGSPVSKIGLIDINGNIHKAEVSARTPYGYSIDMNQLAAK